MFVEEVLSFPEFLTGSIPMFLGIVFACSLIGLLVGYLVATFRHGPVEAFYVVSTVLADAIPDFVRISPKRVGAIAMLSAKEAMRRRVILVTFVIFALALLFGGWFINKGVDHPDQVYVNFVLFGTQLLILLLGLLISAFSLPEDIKNKTIFTIVTKPVRSTEIVLGRTLGFVGLGTLLLLAMGLLSLVFVWRGLSHEHQVRENPDKPNAVRGSIASFNEIVTPGKTKDDKRVSLLAIKELTTTEGSAGHRHQLEYIREVLPKSADPPPQKTIVKTENVDDETIAYYRVICQPFAGHTHPVTIEGEGEDAIVKLGPPVGYFRARVPIYCESVQYFGRDGNIKGKSYRDGSRDVAADGNIGINVGKTWTYRGYLEGGAASLCKAEFEFEEFTEARFGFRDKVTLEMTLGAFRSHKGNMDQRLRASLQIESVQDDPDNPGNTFRSEPLVFETTEYELQSIILPRKQFGRIVDPIGGVVETGSYDLFDDFAENGKLRLVLRCEDEQQYIGVGLGDVYFRARDGQYWANFMKGYVGIWLQMVIVITMTVAFSTFLSTPVTMLATVCTVILGFVAPFIQNMQDIEVAGGGPLESLVRLVSQQNMTTELEESFTTTFIKQADNVLVNSLSSLTHIAPNFGKLDFADFLKYGYFIELDRMLIAAAVTFALCIGLYVLGYFCFKTREIAG